MVMNSFAPKSIKKDVKQKLGVMLNISKTRKCKKNFGPKGKIDHIPLEYYLIYLGIDQIKLFFSFRMLLFKAILA